MSGGIPSSLRGVSTRHAVNDLKFGTYQVFTIPDVTRNIVNPGVRVERFQAWAQSFSVKFGRKVNSLYSEDDRQLRRFRELHASGNEKRKCH